MAHAVAARTLRAHLAGFGMAHSASHHAGAHHAGAHHAGALAASRHAAEAGCFHALLGGHERTHFQLEGPLGHHRLIAGGGGLVVEGADGGFLGLRVAEGGGQGLVGQLSGFHVGHQRRALLLVEGLDGGPLRLSQAQHPGIALLARGCAGASAGTTTGSWLGEEGQGGEAEHGGPQGRSHGGLLRWPVGQYQI